MALKSKHAFTSAKSDGADTTVIRPSDWNADHVMIGWQPDDLGTFSADTGAAPSAVADSIDSITLATSDDSNAAADQVFPLAVRIESGTGTLPKIQLNGDGIWTPERNARTGDVVQLRCTQPSGYDAETVVRLYAPGRYTDWSVTTASAPTYPILSDPTKQKLWVDYLLGCTDTAGATPATTGQSVWTIPLPSGWSPGGDNLMRQDTSGNRPTWQTDGLQTNGTSSYLSLPASISLTGDFTIYFVGVRSNAATQHLIWHGRSGNNDAPLTYSDGNTYLFAGGSSFSTSSTGLIIRRLRRSGTGANNITLTDNGSSSSISSNSTLLIEYLLQRNASGGLVTSSACRTLGLVVVSSHLTPGGADDLAVIAALQGLYSGVTGP